VSNYFGVEFIYCGVNTVLLKPWIAT